MRGDQPARRSRTAGARARARARRGRASSSDAGAARTHGHVVEPLRRPELEAAARATSAAMAAIAFTASRMRRIVPRLRKSGSAGAIGVLPYNRLHIRTRHASIVPENGGGRRVERGVRCRLLSATRGRRGKQNVRDVPDPARRSPAVVISLRRARRQRSTAMPSRPKPPPDPAAGGWSGRFGEPVAERVKRYTASVDFDRRLAAVDIAGSLAHARMLAAVGVLSARRPRRDRARAWRRSAARSSAANSRGRATSRTSTSTSRSG